MPATAPLRHLKECRQRKCNTGEIPHATLRKSICIFEEKVLAKNSALILCTQYDVDDWYYRIDCDRAEDEGSAVAEGILDRIINNKYSIEVKGRISMRKRHAFSNEESGVNNNG